MKNSVKLPYAHSLNDNKLIHISRALKGATYYICPSCRMEVRPRGGDNTEVEEHFYHKSKAEKKCDISPWVSIRSMALQLLDEVLTLSVPNEPTTKASSHTINIIPIEISNKGTQFNRTVQTINDKFLIHILTPEHPLKEIKGCFFHDSILAIDISSTLAKDIKEQDKYLKDVVIYTATYKKWHTPTFSFEKEYGLETEPIKMNLEEKKLQNFADRQIFIIKLGIDPTKVKYSEKEAITNMFSYYRNVEAEAIFYRKKGILFHQFEVEKYFRAYLISKEVYCCIKLGKHYLIYQIQNEAIVVLAKLMSIDEIDNFIRVCKEKEDTFVLDIKYSDMSNDDWTTHMRMLKYSQKAEKLCIANSRHKEFTFVDRVNKLELVSYRYEFFLVANIADSLVLYEVKWNQVMIKARFYSIEKLKEYLDKVMDEELEKADKFF